MTLRRAGLESKLVEVRKKVGIQKPCAKRCHNDGFRFQRHAEILHQVYGHDEESQLGENVDHTDEDPTGQLQTSGASRTQAPRMGRNLTIFVQPGCNGQSIASSMIEIIIHSADVPRMDHSTTWCFRTGVKRWYRRTTEDLERRRTAM